MTNVGILLQHGAKNQVLWRPWSPDVFDIPWRASIAKQGINFFQGFVTRYAGYEEGIGRLKGNKLHNLVLPNYGVTPANFDLLSLQPPMSLLEWYLHANPEGINPEIYDRLAQASSNRDLCERLKPFALLAELGNKAYKIRDPEASALVFELLNKKIQKEPPYIWYKDLKESKMSVLQVYENIHS
jgi:hypothetical protein